MIKTIAAPPGKPSVNVEMTPQEITARINEESANVAMLAAAALKFAAHRALERSDMTAIRCFKAGVLFPQEWQDYVTALRAIVNGGAGPLPAQPDYLKGT